MTVPDSPALSELATVAEQITVPEGYRVEIVGEVIVVSPTPSTRHARVIWVLEGVLRSTPVDTAAVQMVTIELPLSGERYVPDLLVLPTEVLTREDITWIVPISEALLAVEVTSRATYGHDRGRKLRGYAAHAVPFYLLVDVLASSVTLYSEPGQGRYHEAIKVSMGEQLAIPEPFDIVVDTAAFL
ncbi:Uma2 family endonuclease [Tenggerimyces flavus]|uniref:Uma2 family endonuclease n=1 Tax=Tenggerimyces flavus TaxID=1708749 RepID=A0ABV7YGU2_9ACTN|nr:Uma2 family endonuclease [Tenggerimyces flavus]MBM7783410.1 Uma2 family endonuclease [Tenggerimyces flavus]